jgi:tRNA pseudouridine32 synthase/23S rRNA pseudouridine746 synthase
MVCSDKGMAERLMQPLLVHRDEWLVAIDKPAGLLSVPGRGAEKADCMSARVQRAYPDALVVHRLDMATSGLFLMARGAQMQRQLSAAFAGRAVRKHYVAVVAGLLASDAGEVELPLGADWPNRPRQVVDHDKGKPSRTRWHVLDRDAAANTTRVELQPETGRSHQLRVHMQAIGHPILGDALYAPHDVVALSPRLLLHAAGLAFAHPATGEDIVLSCPAPF